MKVTIESTVDPTWIDYLLKRPDIFGAPYHAGYWLGAILYHPDRGWLV
jgi:hypothetical protein